MVPKSPSSVVCYLYTAQKYALLPKQMFASQLIINCGFQFPLLVTRKKEEPKEKGEKRRGHMPRDGGNVGRSIYGPLGRQRNPQDSRASASTALFTLKTALAGPERMLMKLTL